jgi:hypothetical protein
MTMDSQDTPASADPLSVPIAMLTSPQLFIAVMRQGFAASM